MSLQENWNLEIPADTARLGEQLLAAESPYRLIGDHINEFLRLPDFTALYSTLGRGAICPVVLSLVLVFQFLERLPDREAAEMVVVRMDWKYALHLPLNWTGFDFTDLHYFRQRLLEHGAERLLFDRILEWVRQQGLLRKYAKQRTDSTHVLGCVERLSRLELAWETLRLAVRALRDGVPTWYAEAVPASFDERYRLRKSDWKMKDEEIQAERVQVGADGFWLLDRIAGLPEEVRSWPALETLRAVWAQQFDRDQPDDPLRPPPARGEGKEIINSPHDPEARWAEKRGKEWIGYKVHVTETAEEELAVQFLTDIQVTAANEDDGEALDAIQKDLGARGLMPREQYVDRKYVSGPNLASSAERGINLIGPAPLNTSTKPAGYRQEDFTVDLAGQRALCPEGQEAAWWSQRRRHGASAADPRHETVIRFGAACAGCAARDQCQPGKGGRQLTISAYHAELTARRREQELEAYREKMKRRAGIEGTLDGLVWGQGARRARYQGQRKVGLQMFFSGAAANLKRLMRARQVRRAAQATVQP